MFLNGFENFPRLRFLGFYDREVTTYVYRENIIFNVHWYYCWSLLWEKFCISIFLATVEVDLIMFSPIIHWPSYLYSAVITMCFTLFVMVIMHRKLKKINMIEALKIK